MDMKPSFKICKHYIQGGLTMRKLFTSLVAASIVASSAFVPLSTIADEKNIDFDEPELYHSVNDYTEKEKQLYELLQRHDPIPLSEIQAIVGTYEPVSQEEIDAENKYYAEHYGLGSVRGNNDENTISSSLQTEIAESIATADYDQVDDYGLFNNYIPREHITYMRNDGKKFRIFYEVNENIYYREIDTVPEFSFKGSAKEFAEKYLEENKIGHMMTDIDMTGVDSIYQTAYADGFTVVFYESVPINTRIKAAAEIAASVKDNTGLPVFMSISPADAVKLSDVNTDAVKVYADVNEFITAEYSGAVVINTTFEGSGQNVTHFITPDGVFHAVKSSSSHYEVITEEGKELPVDEINEKLGESGSLESRGDTYLLINKTGSDDVFLELASYEEVCAIQNVFDFRLYTSDMGYTYADQLFVGGDIDDEAFIAEFPELNLTISEYPETFGDMTHCFTLRPALSSMTKSETAYNGVKKLAESGYEYAFSVKLTTGKAAWTYAGKGVSTVFSRADENDDNIVKNYSYFNSLNREELLEEYNLYCREIGKDEIVPLYITEEGIIKDDFIKNHAINMMKHNFAPTHYMLEPSYKWKAERSSYGWNSKAFLSAVNSKLEAGKLEAGRLVSDTEYDLSYYGFDKAENDIEEVRVAYDESRIRIEYQDWTKNVYNNITSIKDAEERVCEFLRCELTLYYSDFFKDFCRNCEGDVPEFDMTWTGCYLSGGSKEFKLDKGDANVDGEVGLADALTILQYIANSQKYPMYEEGFEVADIVGDGDGVTPLDALEIQKWDANIF